MVKPESVDKVSHFYERFGIFTLIVGRFVPFGVRNALFLTAGLGRMGFMKFALSDLLAATISCSVYFIFILPTAKPLLPTFKKATKSSLRPRLFLWWCSW